MLSLPSAFLYIIMCYHHSLAYFMNNPCGCNVSVIFASPTHPENTSITTPAGQNYTTDTSDPVGPLFGETVFFKGPKRGGSVTVYDYQIQCKIPCWISGITVEGAAFWPKDTITLYTNDKSTVLGLIDITNYKQKLVNEFASYSVDMTSNPYYATLFRLDEINGDGWWRCRTLINLTMIASTSSPTLSTATPSKAPSKAPIELNTNFGVIVTIRFEYELDKSANISVISIENILTNIIDEYIANNSICVESNDYDINGGINEYDNIITANLTILVCDKNDQNILSTQFDQSLQREFIDEISLTLSVVDDTVVMDISIIGHENEVIETRVQTTFHVDDGDITNTNKDDNMLIVYVVIPVLLCCVILIMLFVWNKISTKRSKVHNNRYIQTRNANGIEQISNDKDVDNMDNDDYKEIMYGKPNCMEESEDRDIKVMDDMDYGHVVNTRQKTVDNMKKQNENKYDDMDYGNVVNTRQKTLVNEDSELQ